ncbi:aspartyl protease family protein [Croceitalea rosinachiae]|uniref:PDZ domain-containing protein n=1 Tax=Croceitalea rosinachiae TaxID=3075596 RepID=A0ABU3AEJ7_9FLAO|nr:PDZ domain-containing protein [Croceitalea sp. F388]MDT0608414.1 PDZ domain-containing protein [Croceitalea sp. F388]
MNRVLTYITLVFFCFSISGFGQRFHISNKKKYEKIKFELVNNLMVVPVELNGTKLSFILDTGVSSPILFNLTNQDSIQINNVSEITLQGLGEGDPIQALKSTKNTFKIGNAKNFNQALYVVIDRDLNFSTSLGIPIHGIIGYDLFKDFVVEVNYSSSSLKLYNPNDYQYKTSKRKQTLPLSLIDKKAFVDGAVTKEDDSEIPVKLLVDTGSSDALWLFHDPDKGLDIPEKNYEDFLGQGLSGNIFGKRTKLKGIRIGMFQLNEAKAAFPYKESFSAIKDFGDRNGSVGGEVLKRFNIVFDYPRNKITLSKNGYFNRPFQYNLAGIELQHNGVRYIAERIADSRGVVKAEHNDSFGNVQILMDNSTRLSLVPEIVVSGIRAGSPAEEAGLKEGDVILAINGKEIHDYKIQEILQMLNEREGKRVRVQIERYNKDLLFTFVLKDIFETKKP